MNVLSNEKEEKNEFSSHRFLDFKSVRISGFWKNSKIENLHHKIQLILVSAVVHTVSVMQLTLRRRRIGRERFRNFFHKASSDLDAVEVPCPRLSGSRTKWPITKHCPCNNICNQEIRHYKIVVYNVKS